MPNYLTSEGLRELKKELDFLKNVKRKEITERLKRAVSFGDLSENADYAQTKEDQALLERKIVDLEKVLADAVLVERKPKNVIQIGSVVLVESKGRKEKLKIVGSEEADSLRNKISVDSPLGKAILNKNKGEIVKIFTPEGSIKYKILKIDPV